MTAHARQRLDERFPQIDAAIALERAKSNAHRRWIADSLIDGQTYCQIWVSGTPLFPVVSNDGAVLSFLTEGMTARTEAGEITLTRLPPRVGADNIQIIQDGECIPGAGAYRMSMAHYHSQDVCPDRSISSTGIRLASVSPHHFWKTWAGNPDRYPDKDDSDSLILGNASHALILGDEVFDEHFIYVPADAPQRPTATQIAAFERTGKWSESAAPRAEFWLPFDERAGTRLLLKEAQVETIKYMAENLNANQLAREMLISDLTEISMIWQDVTGLWIKSRPDCIPTNGYDFGDLKTFAPKSRNLEIAVQRSITDFSYPQQMALAIDGARHVFGTTATRCGLVFCQTSLPYEVIPVEIDEDSLYWAACLNRQGIDNIAQGLETGDWPGAVDKIITYSYPPSMQTRFEDLQSAGIIPNITRDA